MHQRNKGKKIQEKNSVCLPVCLVSFLSVMNPMEFVYDSQITTCSKNHPHRKPNYGGTAFLVVSNHLHNKKTTIFNKIFAAKIAKKTYEKYTLVKKWEFLRPNMKTLQIAASSELARTTYSKWRQMLVNNWGILSWFFAIWFFSLFANFSNVPNDKMWEKM